MNKKIYNQVNAKMTTKIIFLIVSTLLSSCIQEEFYSPKKATIPVLTTSSASVQLDEKNVSQSALTLSWTSGSNHGTESAIEYTLQIDKKGNNFSAPVNLDLGRVVYATSLREDVFNNILLNSFGVTPGAAIDLEFRIKSTTLDSSVDPDFSNVASVNVTSYTPITTTLYLIGSATSIGWSADNALPMIQDSDDHGVFRFEGELNPGELKFITTLGQFLPSYQKGSDDSHIVFRTNDGQPDDKFIIDETGTYAIELNLFDLTINITNLSIEPPYSQLWIVGDATPNGWNIANPNELIQDASDPFIFHYNAALNSGEFKISTGKGDGAWCNVNWYRPLTNHPDLTVTTVQLTTGCDGDDNKWQIANAGMYKITLNLHDNTISIKPFTTYTQLWIIGDAGPNGWNIDTPSVTMTVDPDNANVYTYTGNFSTGEFKIALGTGNWCGDWIRPLSNHPALTETSMAFNSGCDIDNKWQITTAGTYKVTVDQLNETISIVQQ